MLEKNYQRNKHYKLPWLNPRCDVLEVAKKQRYLRWYCLLSCIRCFVFWLKIAKISRTLYHLMVFKYLLLVSMPCVELSFVHNHTNNYIFTWSSFGTIKKIWDNFVKWQYYFLWKAYKWKEYDFFLKFVWWFI